MTGRQRITAFLKGRPVDQLPLMPITMMFAADVAGVRYRDYATDHRVLVEAQIRTAEEFEFDHVSCISDPAREAADCGAVVEYFDDQPPAIVEEQALLATKDRLVHLKVPDPLASPRMRDRVSAADLFKTRIGREKFIEGWIEGPCAEAADLRGINTLMLDFFDDPPFVRELFDFVVEMELKFAAAQVEAGVDIMGIGDAAASLVSPQVYEELIWPYEKKLIDGVHQLGVPVRLHICGNTRQKLAGIGRLKCEIVDLDYPAPMKEGRAQMGPWQALLGNVHPVTVMRDGNPELIKAAIAECHFEAGSRYVVGAGCELPRGTPAENVLALAEYARCQSSCVI